MNAAAGPRVDGLGSFRAWADTIFIGTLGLHLVLCLVIAFMNGSWTPALGVGGPAFLVPFVLSRGARGALVTRIAVGCSFMIFSALLIHQTRGTIEAHFGIFVLLAFLVLYCDWRPLVAAAALIAVHHLGFAWLQATGAGIFVFPQIDGVGRVLVHAAYVIVETGLLCYMAGLLRGMVADGMIVADFASRVSAGHLDYPFDPEAVRQRPLIAAVAAMQQALHTTLVDARQTADSLQARAGELGRGFAVVADEVRKLAERTTTATDEIGRMMNDMRGAKESVLTCIDSAVKLVETGVAHAAAAGDSIDLITGRASGVGDIVSSISHSLEEQSTAAGEIARHVDNIGLMAERSAAVTRDIASEAESLTRAAVGLHASLGRFKL